MYAKSVQAPTQQSMQNTLKEIAAWLRGIHPKKDLRSATEQISIMTNSKHQLATLYISSLNLKSFIHYHHMEKRDKVTRSAKLPFVLAIFAEMCKNLKINKACFHFFEFHFLKCTFKNRLTAGDTSQPHA